MRNVVLLLALCIGSLLASAAEAQLTVNPVTQSVRRGLVAPAAQCVDTQGQGTVTCATGGTYTEAVNLIGGSVAGRLCECYPPPRCHVETFTWEDLDNYVFHIDHNLGHTTPVVAVYDHVGALRPIWDVQLVGVRLVSNNRTDLWMGWEPMTGPWTVRVCF